MNCHNCGETLDGDGTQSIVVCEHCRTYRSFGTPDSSVDRVVSLGKPGRSKCPCCRQRLTQAAMDGLLVEYCDDCTGVLIPEDLFAMLVRNRRAEYRGAASHPTTLDSNHLDGELHCPACRNAMDVHPCYGPGHIVIDSCSNCRLVWLDLRETAHTTLAMAAS